MISTTLLLVAGDRLRETYAAGLRAVGHRVLTADGVRTGRRALSREMAGAVLLDRDLPDGDGLVLLEEAAERLPGVPVVVLSNSEVDSAVEAMRRGAADVVPSNAPHERLFEAIERCVKEARARGSVLPVRDALFSEMAELGMVGFSEPLLDLFATIKRIAPHQSTILLLGESGTGKELIARALHALGKHASGSFVAVNCATLSEQILESELFGHERGAFTSADRPKPGVMELAHRGTLFLDEVNEMGPGCQAKLLRALERREFRRVGGTAKIHVDLNVIAASNADLEALVAAGQFRADLYYRLKVVTLNMPPLRERREAIPALVHHFLGEIARRTHMERKRLTHEALSRLVAYSWPGNVRELKNTLESLTLMVPRSTITRADLPPAIREARSAEIRFPVGVRIEDAEREIIVRTLESATTMKAAAQTLGIGLRTLHTKIRKYRIPRRRS